MLDIKVNKDLNFVELVDCMYLKVWCSYALMNNRTNCYVSRFKLHNLASTINGHPHS